MRCWPFFFPGGLGKFLKQFTLTHVISEIIDVTLRGATLFQATLRSGEKLPTGY